MPQRGEERAEVHALGEEVRDDDDDVYRLPLCGCALCRARRDRRARFLAWTTSFRMSALYISVTTTFSLAASSYEPFRENMKHLNVPPAPLFSAHIMEYPESSDASNSIAEHYVVLIYALQPHRRNILSCA